MGVGVLLAARHIAENVLHAPALVSSVRMAVALLVLGAINGAQTGILQGLEAYRRLALGSLVQGIAALVFMVGGTYAFGLRGAVAGLLLYTLVGTAVLHQLIRSERARQGIPATYGNLGATLPIIWRFSLPVMLAGMSIAPVKWAAETLLARRVGFGELGIFHAAMTIATMLVTLVSTMNAPLISLAANAGASPNAERMQYASLYSSWYAGLLLALPFVAFPQVVAILFGANYATPQLFRAVVLLAAYCAMMSYYQGIIRQFAQSGSMWFGLCTNLLEGAALLVGFYAFAGRGAAGLALAYVLSYVARILVSIPYLARGTVVPRRLLLDRYFLATMLLLVVAVAAQLRLLR